LRVEDVNLRVEGFVEDGRWKMEDGRLMG